MKKWGKKYGKYVLGIGLYFLVLANGVWGVKSLSRLEMARREMIRNPNDIEARLEWWRGLTEAEYWEESLKEEVYFDGMYQAVKESDQEIIDEIKDLMRKKYPGYLVERLEEMKNDEEKDKDWWIKKAKIETELGNYEEAMASIGMAREMDGIDEELERMERELLRNK